MRYLRRLCVAPIRFYQRFISPFTPAMCRFAPTCSQYVVDAILVHGILRGGAMGTWRVVRCHPFNKGGWDPVPGSRLEASGPDACCANASLSDALPVEDADAASRSDDEVRKPPSGA